MTKHPIAGAFVIAAVISLVLGAVVLRVYSAQQSPWALALVVLAFPFIWFLAWIIICGFAWWQDSTAGALGPSDEDQPPPPPH
jgi:hypothetical protein